MCLCYLSLLLHICTLQGTNVVIITLPRFYVRNMYESGWNMRNYNCKMIKCITQTYILKIYSPSTVYSSRLKYENMVCLY